VTTTTPPDASWVALEWRGVDLTRNFPGNFPNESKCLKKRDPIETPCKKDANSTFVLELDLGNNDERTRDDKFCCVGSRTVDGVIPTSSDEGGWDAATTVVLVFVMVMSCSLDIAGEFGRRKLSADEDGKDDGDIEALVNDSDDLPEYFTGDMSREEAESVLSSNGLVAGDFVVRDSKGAKVLTVVTGDSRVYAHHKITIVDNVEVRINGSPASIKATSVAKAVETWLAHPAKAKKDLSVTIEKYIHDNAEPAPPRGGSVGAATARAWKLEDAKSDGSSDGSSDESDDGAAPTNYHLAGVASPRSNKLSCV